MISRIMALNEDLRDALTRLVAIDDSGHLFDCESDQGGYKSQELEDVLDIIEAALARS